MSAAANSTTTATGLAAVAVAFACRFGLKLLARTPKTNPKQHNDEQHEQQQQQQRGEALVDDARSSPTTSSAFPSGFPNCVTLQTENTILKLTYRKLESFDVHAMVLDPACGAITTFTGTTRDYFHNRKVSKLSYEAYAPLAIKQMGHIDSQMRSQFEIKKLAILHRLGECPVGESSVIIAASSPHRKASLEAVAWAIDTLKERVPIWKKEHYEGNFQPGIDDSKWKENKEYDPVKLCQP